jgi:hypothetical protein
LFRPERREQDSTQPMRWVLFVWTSTVFYLQLIQFDSRLTTKKASEDWLFLYGGAHTVNTLLARYFMSTP